MRVFRSAAFAVAAVLTTASFAQTILDPGAGLLVGKAAGEGVQYGRDPLGGFRVKFGYRDAFFVVQLPAGTSFGSATHVDYRLRNYGSRIAHVELNVSSNAGAGWMSAAVALAPGEAASLTMPLMSPEPFGLRVLPSPIGTARFQSRSIGNVFANDVRGLYFFNKSYEPTDVAIEHIALAKYTVPLTSVVDTYGQQRNLTWQGKVTSDDQLKAQIPHDPDGTYPYSADPYGGILGGKNYGASPRFRLVRDQGYWMLVTPAGNRFFSFGVNEVCAQGWTIVDGRESLFTDLTNLKTKFPSHFTRRDGVLGFTPYSINLERKYGANWRSMADSIFMRRLRSWGFNTVGVNSWDSLMSQRQMPSTFGLNLWTPHPKLTPYAGVKISDVFDPAFALAARSDIKRRVTEVSVHHPFSIGMFVDNELPWGVGKSSRAAKRYAISVAALHAVGSASHTALLAQLQQKYGTLAKLNLAWGTSFTSWSGLSTYAVPSTPNANVVADLAQFLRAFADRYFSTIDQAITESGYAGLYLGCRFTKDDYTPEVVEAAKKYVDIMSFNIYQVQPDHTNPDIYAMDFPVMISEFCFGANDLGRTGVPLFPTVTEKGRIAAYKQYVDGLRSWRNLVGVHWYRWQDFPTTAKSDGDNMHEGLQSITDGFYSGLHQQTRLSTQQYMEHLRNVAPTFSNFMPLPVLGR